MTDDVIFRSEVRKAIESELWISDSTKAVFRNILIQVPAAEVEKVFEAVGLMKEAFEMAKADLVPVVRCENCTHQQKVWHDDKRMKEGGFFIYSCELNDDPFVAHVVDGNPGEFCYAGERRTDK